MAKKTTKRSTRTIRALFADAKEDLAQQKDVFDPPSEVARNGVIPGRWDGFPYDQLPPDCPVQVHGINGSIAYMTDANGQLVEVEKGDAVTLAKLFGRFQNYPEWAFPRWAASKKDPKTGDELPPKINGMEYLKLFRCLWGCAARKGLFDPSTQHRGRGGWKDTDGNFLWHSGQYLYMVDDKGKMIQGEPSEHMGSLYTVQPEITKPWMEPIARIESPAQQLVDDFATWTWERPYLDPILLVGWLVTSLMGGALEWRPMIFTSGGAGVGKSTLHHIIQGVMGNSIMATADTTAAGIYQNIKQDSTGVIVDEFEAMAENMAKRQGVLDLARIAPSGGDMFRGGANHTGTSFNVRCSFFFCAINAPPLNTADKSRMAFLNLGKLDKNVGFNREFVYSPDQGRMILRQIMDGFEAFQNDILPYWSAMLHKAGFTKRQVDTYGTLLAAAELVLGQEKLEACGLPVNNEAELGAMIAAATKAERQEQQENWHKCLEHLLAAPIDAYKGGERPSVGSIIADLQADYAGQPKDLPQVRKVLALAGLGIKDIGQVPGVDGGKSGYMLCVPSSGSQLNRLFYNTEYQGEVWNSALKQGPSDFILRQARDRAGLTNNSFKVKIDLSTKHCVLIDLKAYQDWQDADEDEPAPDAPSAPDGADGDEDYQFL